MTRRRLLGVGLAVALAAGAVVAGGSGAGAEQQAPGPVSSVSLSRADGEVTADWPAVSGATKYHVTYSTDGGESWHAPVDDHQSVAADILTFSADNAKTYVVGVRAGNEAGWGPWRNSPPAGPYTPPADPAALSGQAASIPAITLSTDKVIAPEQGTAAYTVRLATAPTQDVTVTLTRNNTGDTDITFDTDSGTTGDQDTLTFTSTTWSTPQQVTVAAADDADKLYGTATITHTADSNYGDKTADLAVAEGDNDVCQGTAAVNNATSGGLVDDCNTLLALETTLAGTATLDPDWDTGTAIATWQGITVANNRVTRLILTKQSLDGTIPNTLGNLAGLRILYLNQNSLSGPIPPQLGNLTNLTRLFLDRQRRDADTNCDNSGLTGTVPPELGNLPNPHTFYLDVNCLTGTIPTSLTKLTSLRNLGLSRNKLTGNIPEEIDNLTNLTVLSFGTNGLTGTIPTQIGNLTNLRGLYLHENDLTGTIPTQIGSLTNLTNLLLSRNSLTGAIPEGICNLTKLTSLALELNSLSGSIPNCIGNLTKMYDLILSNNNLNGPIPAGIGNFTKLHRLHLNFNSLTGSIPKELGNLSNLSGFWLDNNNLSGSIPKELGNLSNKLHQFFLDNNNLTGSIPKELGNLTGLRALRLHNNQLSGAIPKELGNLTNLTQIYLNDNGLTGSIPAELGNLVPGVVNSDLRNNSLTGCIPPNLAAYIGSINPQKDSQDNNVTLPVCVGIRLSKGSVGVTEGSSATYTVRLTSAPSADVTVALTKAAGNDVTFNPSTLTFTSSTHSTAQTVTLSAAADNVHDGGAATITHTATSADGDYNNKTTKLIATEIDNTPVLTAVGVTATAAVLTIARHTGNWYYTADTGPHTACQGPVSAAFAALTGLAPNTAHSYTAHSASPCTTANLLTTTPAAFTTLPPPPPPYIPVEIDLFPLVVARICTVLAGADYGDHPDDLAKDVCSTGTRQPPTPKPTRTPDSFYSGIVTGPHYCANHPFGDSPTYPHDSDRDGIADTCSLPHTRREAVVRHIATAALNHPTPYQHAGTLAQACTTPQEQQNTCPTWAKPTPPPPETTA